MRLDKYLSLTGPTRKQARGMVLTGRVCVNGVVARDVGMNVSFADEIALDGVSLGAKQELYIMINKPAGMVVHPGHGNYEHTLLNALAYYFQGKIDINNPNIGLVHRIDKDTSGLLLIAKTPEAKTDLGMQFLTDGITSS